MTAQTIDYAAEARKCTRCGSCQTICPVHGRVLTEATCARGKVQLMRGFLEGRIPLNKEIQEIASNCLMCKACTQNCPSGVHTDQLFFQLRKALAKEVGLPWAKKAAFTALTYRRLFDMGLRLGSVFQSLVLKEAPDGRGGKVSRIPLPAAGLNLRRVLPALARRPLRSLLADRPRLTSPKATVALFPGCMLSYVYPQAGVAIVDVLARNNIDAVLLDGLGCCGVPALSNGDFETSGMLARANVRALSSRSFDAVITGCASCGAALKHDYATLIEDGPEREKWETLSGKVFDIAQFLVANGFSDSFKGQALKVTYHDPCHLARGMGVTREPRELLKALPGVEFVEMRDANTCCGCGGTFSLTQYDMARRINDAKLDNIERSGAEIVATGCSACKMHINDGLSRRRGNVRVLHTAEILAMAYKG